MSRSNPRIRRGYRFTPQAVREINALSVHFEGLDKTRVIENAVHEKAVREGLAEDSPKKPLKNSSKLS
jgi:hypothetical protein